MPTDGTTLNRLLNTALIDFGAAWHASLVVLGDQLGLYRALDGAGPLSSHELADRTGTTERYVREWLAAEAAGGYVTYHPETGRYSLSEEQALLVADENSPAFVVGAFQGALAAAKIVPRLAEAFRTGTGIGWQAHDPDLFVGTERLFRPAYLANLTSAWIPALDGVEDRLRAGARVADVGCGHGASTIIMGQAYPASTFTGFDFHEPSIVQASRRAATAGVTGRVSFRTAKATDFDGGPYDLVTTFDCLHDMGDPVGAAAHVRTTLAPNGAWMIVEPFAGDRVEENLTPLGRAFYSASTLVCTPCSLAQARGAALGAQAGEARLRGVVIAGGFTRFRRAAETPFNLVFEAKR